MNRSNFITVIKYLMGALALIALLSPSLTARQDESPQLRQKITELEQRMERLEGFFKTIDVAQKEQMGDEYGWQNKKNWRRLEIGMTEDHVKTFLGKPTKVIKGVRTLWYYPSIYCGYVSFDQEGHITGWSEP